MRTSGSPTSRGSLYPENSALWTTWNKHSGSDLPSPRTRSPVANRSYRFFMMPDEFTDFLCMIQCKMSLHAVLVRPGNPELIELPERDGATTMSDGGLAYWVCLAPDPPRPDQLSAPQVLVGPWGWVKFDVPTVQEGTLYMADLGTKSDWYDAATHTILENPAPIRLYDRILRQLRKRLPFEAWGIIPGDEAPWRSGVRYSAAVAEWARGGGRLKDGFAPRVTYTPEPERA